MKEELWRKIDGFPESFEVSDQGRVRENIQGENPVYRNIYKSGKYYCVSINGRPYPIHRLVAKCFLDNYNTKCSVVHIDKDMKNNKLSNLVCKSKRELMESSAKTRGYCGTYVKVNEENKVFATVASAAYYYRIPRECVDDAIRNNTKCFGLTFKFIDVEDNKTDKVYYVGRQDIVELGRKSNSIEDYDNYLKYIE